jgi:hypothetical protein
VGTFEACDRQEIRLAGRGERNLVPRGEHVGDSKVRKFEDTTKGDRVCILQIVG